MLSRSNPRLALDVSRPTAPSEVEGSPQSSGDDVRGMFAKAPGPDWPLLPWARGPLSGAILSALQREPGTLGSVPPLRDVDALSDDDFSLALYLCYEVHFRGATDPDWEWDPALLSFRAQLERVFVDRLRDEVVTGSTRFACEVAPVLDEMIRSSNALSLSEYFVTSGSLHQFREFCVHQSANQLRVPDPHTFAIARLTDEAKAALVEIHYDECGCGDASATHAKLFSDTLIALGLDATYGSYVEVLPGVTLALVNLVSLFALHRRWRAALVGHLAVAELTSSIPMGRYSQALARFDIGSDARRFFEVHAATDERHLQIVRDRLVGGLIRAEPQLAVDLLFGGAALLMLEERFAVHLLGAWAKEHSSLVPWEVS